jgi:magnesium transporter
MLETYPQAADPEVSGTAPVWIDLFNPTPEESARVTRDFHVQVPSRESLQEIESSSRTRTEAENLFVSMPLATLDQSGLKPVPLGFLLSPRLLVTVRFSELQALTQAKAHCHRDAFHDSASVFAAIVEAMVDFTADLLEKLSTDLATVSTHIFARHGVAVNHNKRFRRALRVSLLAVGTSGDRLSHIRESVLGLQRIITYVADVATWLPPELKARLKTIREDLVSLVEFETHLSSKSQFLLDAILGLISTEQNDMFKVLTIASVVGIPPTLIASMYGMNFHFMPELGWRWGYTFGLALIALSIVLPILWFKRRGWW